MKILADIHMLHVHDDKSRGQIFKIDHVSKKIYYVLRVAHE